MSAQYEKVATIYEQIVTATKKSRHFVQVVTATKTSQIIRKSRKMFVSNPNFSHSDSWISKCAPRSLKPYPCLLEIRLKKLISYLKDMQVSPLSVQ
ncbi:hypothetical protein XENTR_v10002759 [Xenopus tropicalis]|nr:hypothetical protein XENTR_v10002759 [Xenopus tropicalis]